MKVVFLNDSMCGGGAEKAMANIVNELAQSIDIDLISLEDNFCIPLNSSIKKSYFNKEINSKFKKFFGLIVDAYRLKSFVEKNSHHTVISFQYRSNFINVISKLLGSKHRVIVSERNYPKESLAYLPFFNFLLKKLYPKADKVICNASDTKKLLMTEYGLENVQLIFNGYNKEEIRELSEYKIEEKYKKIFEKDVILNIGRLTKQKGQSYLLEAFAKLGEGYHLIILGEGEERSSLTRLSEELNIHHRVFFIGYQKNPYPFIRAAKSFVFTSLYEGFPNALSEALICSVPVVSFNFHAGANDLIDEKALVKIGDIQSLVEAIEKANVLEDRTLNIREVADVYKEIIEEGSYA